MSEHYITVSAHEGLHEVGYAQYLDDAEMEHLDQALPYNIELIQEAMVRHGVPVADLHWEGITR